MLVGAWTRNVIYAIAILLALPWLLVRSLRTGRYRQGLKQKLLGLSRRDYACTTSHIRIQSQWMGGLLEDEYQLQGFSDPWSQQSTIWLHGVSVGEIQLLAPIVSNLRESHSDAKIVVSTTTESGMQLARKLLPDCYTFFFPLDFSWAVKRTLQTLNPKLIVLAELELWPNLIAFAKLHGTRLVVMNGRLSEKSCTGYRRFSWFTKGMFGKLSHVGAQTNSYAERFIACGCDPRCITVTGSTKFDNVNFSRDCPEIDKLRSLAGLDSRSRVILVGSTQDPEELAAAEAFLTLRADYPDVRMVIVPRHPDRFDEVAQRLQILPCKLVRRSEIEDFIDTDEWEILLVDSVGELRWWWGLSEIAVVGGSFGERGGQNMLEPAAYGANVAFGPNTANFRDIAQTLVEHDAATRLPDLASLATWLRQELADPVNGQRRGENATALVAAQQGATQQTVQILDDQLKESPGKRLAA